MYIIGITGGSGTGKTTFIKHLRAAFSDEELCIISQDNYYRPREEQLTDEKGVKNFDLPESIDGKAFAADLKSLLAGNTVTKKEYTFNNSTAEASTIVWKPAPVIIVEGIFAFHFHEIASLMDFQVFFHTREHLALIRRIKRDSEERNYPLDDVMYRFENHVQPAFDKYIEPYREEADVVINNNKHFDNALEMIKSFIKLKISTV